MTFNKFITGLFLALFACTCSYADVITDKDSYNASNEVKSLFKQQSNKAVSRVPGTAARVTAAKYLIDTCSQRTDSQKCLGYVLVLAKNYEEVLRALKDMQGALQQSELENLFLLKQLNDAHIDIFK